MGGWWLMRRSLAPVEALTRAIERIHDRNLHEQLPRTGNGDELDRLTQVFNDMTARLDQAFQRIREFTLHASHELKTPLTVMQGELETSCREENLTETQRDRVLSLVDEVQRLAKIVDGLSLLTKADAGQVSMVMEPVQMDGLVREAVEDARLLGYSDRIEVNAGRVRAGHRARRPAPAAAGAAEPGRQRRQVQRAWRDGERGAPRDRLRGAA